MKTIKIILIFTLILVATSTGWPQLAVQTSYIKPSADYGMIFKPTLEYELLLYFSEMDDLFTGGVSLGYYHLTPRKDTFAIYGIVDDEISQGFDVWNSHNVVSLGFFLEQRILDASFTPVLGCDVMLYNLLYTRNYYIPGIRSSDGFYHDIAFGVIPRLGFLYRINDYWEISSGLGKSLSFDAEGVTRSYWKTYLRVGYDFY